MEPTGPATLKALAGSLPLQRVGRTEEVVATICFLANPAASYVTGTAPAADRGLGPELRRKSRGAAPSPVHGQGLLPHGDRV